MTINKWEQFAKSFEELNNYVVGIKNIKTVKRRLSSLSEIGDMLELGCGNGTYTECFVGSASKIVATDISEHMITVARSRFNDQATVTVETTDCFKLPHLSHDVNPSRYTFNVLCCVSLKSLCLKQ